MLPAARQNPLRHQYGSAVSPRKNVMRMIRVIGLLRTGLILWALGVPQWGAAQTAPAAAVRSRAAVRPPAPAPVAPETISRTPEGGVTIRAVRIPEPIRLDGRLDEP